MPVPTPASDVVESIIREAAETEILPRFARLGEGERWRKRSGSMVTAADVGAERLLAAELPPLLPGSVALGEEMASDDPGLVGLLDGDAPVWVLDPVDGTANFADGSPEFAVMVGLVARRETIAGWIYRPAAGVMYAAEAGAGAFRDGARIRVAAAPPDILLMRGSLGGRLRRGTDLPERFARVTATGCIGVDYCALAEGGIHFAHYRGIHPWDHAPGQLMHAEAGGFGLGFDRARHELGRPGEGGVLLAPDAPAWDALRETIAGALERLDRDAGGKRRETAT